MTILVLELPNLPLKAKKALKVIHMFLSMYMHPMQADSIMRAAWFSASFSLEPGLQFAENMTLVVRSLGANGELLHHLLQYAALKLRLTEGWQKGDIALVMEEIPGDDIVKSFYKGQTFIVEGFAHEHGTGQLLLAGGRFRTGILAIRCAPTKTNSNPYPLCRRGTVDDYIHRM